MVFLGVRLAALRLLMPLVAAPILGSKVNGVVAANAAYCCSDTSILMGYWLFAELVVGALYFNFIEASKAVTVKAGKAHGFRSFFFFFHGN